MPRFVKMTPPASTMRAPSPPTKPASPRFDGQGVRAPGSVNRGSGSGAQRALEREAKAAEINAARLKPTA